MIYERGAPDGVYKHRGITMDNTGLKQIRLDPEQLADKEAMTAFMERELDLPEWFGGNLDALSDVLSEVSDETVFVVEVGSVGAFTADGYPKKVIRVISAAAKENPHLHLYLTDSDWL